jgi:hypothetical protein
MAMTASERLVAERQATKAQIRADHYNVPGEPFVRRGETNAGTWRRSFEGWRKRLSPVLAFTTLTEGDYAAAFHAYCASANPTMLEKDRSALDRFLARF